MSSVSDTLIPLYQTLSTICSEETRGPSSFPFPIALRLCDCYCPAPTTHLNLHPTHNLLEIIQAQACTKIFKKTGAQNGRKSCSDIQTQTSNADLGCSAKERTETGVRGQICREVPEDSWCCDPLSPHRHQREEPGKTTDMQSTLQKQS